MDSPPLTARAWAQQLLAVEAARKPPGDTDEHEVLRVFEKLRGSLTQFIGADGFTALVRRGLALARAEVPSLETATVAADGRLQRIAKPAADLSLTVDGATAVTAHLLALLVTFIGEPITLRMLRQIWPEINRTTESEDSK